MSDDLQRGTQTQAQAQAQAQANAARERTSAHQQQQQFTDDGNDNADADADDVNDPDVATAQLEAVKKHHREQQLEEDATEGNNSILEDDVAAAAAPAPVVSTDLIDNGNCKVQTPENNDALPSAMCKETDAHVPARSEYNAVPVHLSPPESADQKTETTEGDSRDLDLNNPSANTTLSEIDDVAADTFKNETETVSTTVTMLATNDHATESPVPSFIAHNAETTTTMKQNSCPTTASPTTRLENMPNSLHDTGNTNVDPVATFMNHGLAFWQTNRAQWLVGSSSFAHNSNNKRATQVPVDDIIDVMFASPRQIREDGGPQFFPRPVALPQMIDILVDLWYVYM
jgi:hypothetical protein